jgi:hypothetical protein
MKISSTGLRPTLCLLMLAGSLAGAAETGPAKPSAPARTHVLFMGADLSVQREKRYYQVEDVTGSELKIRIGKKEFFVPTRSRSTSLKVSNSLKLSGASVQLDDLQSGPAYTSANDPMRKAIAASGSAGGASALQDLAQGQVNQVAVAEAHAADAAARYGALPEGKEALVNAQNFKNELQLVELASAGSTQELKYSSQNSAAAHVDKMQGEMAEGNFDAMEVSFKISSPVELDDPYMVILFRFQERDAKAGEVGMLIHAKSLDPVTDKPKYVRVREAGLPRGFKYVDCEVHIYNRGEEVATNASAKRVELSRGEAQQYLVIEHIGANKGATVAASVVPGTLPPARRKLLSGDQLNRTVYAKIDKDGAVLGVYSDEGCNLQLDDAATLAALGEAFFKPALRQGKPVEGTALVRLGEI